MKMGQKRTLSLRRWYKAKQGSTKGTKYKKFMLFGGKKSVQHNQSVQKAQIIPGQPNWLLQPASCKPAYWPYIPETAL